VTDGHRRHLCASLSSFEEFVQNMERAGHDGRSPTSGQKLTPLASRDWKPIAEALRIALARLTEAVRAVAPEKLSGRECAEGLSGTLFRLSILLRQAEEEIVDDLKPARMEGKFGALEEAERRLLADLTRAMRKDLSSARERIDAIRARRGGQE